MAFDKTAFAADILTGIQVDESTKAEFEKLLSNPVVAKRFEESTLRQSDYSKQVQAAKDYHGSLVQWEKETKAKYDQEQKLLRQKLVDEGIDLNDPNQAKPVDYEERLRTLSAEHVNYTNAMTRLNARHLKEFGEVMDDTKLMEIVQRDGINVNMAFDKLVQPERDKIRQVEIDKQLAQAREEGKAEAIKNYQLPTVDNPLHNTVPHAINGLNADRSKQEFGAMAAVKAWEDARRK